MMGLGALKVQKHTTTMAQSAQLFVGANASRSHYAINDNGLGMVPEDSYILLSKGEEMDVSDSPCLPPSKNARLKAKKLGLGGTRGLLLHSETYGPSRFTSAH
jgi:M-phase inducer tyrosine phosphatase